MKRCKLEKRQTCQFWRMASKSQKGLTCHPQLDAQKIGRGGVHEKYSTALAGKRAWIKHSSLTVSLWLTIHVGIKAKAVGSEGGCEGAGVHFCKKKVKGTGSKLLLIKCINVTYRK